MGILSRAFGGRKQGYSIKVRGRRAVGAAVVGYTLPPGSWGHRAQLATTACTGGVGVVDQRCNSDADARTPRGACTCLLTPSGRDIWGTDGGVQPALYVVQLMGFLTLTLYATDADAPYTPQGLSGRCPRRRWRLLGQTLAGWCVCVCVCVCVYGPQAAVLSRPLQSLTDAPGGAGALQYAVTFHGAYNVLPGVRELKVQLKRANKAAYTVVRPVQQGEVVWEEMVPLTTSLYADIKTGQ